MKVASKIFEVTDNGVSIVWGFKPSTLTPNGISKAFTDLIIAVIGMVLFLGYPQRSADPMITWIGCVCLLLLGYYTILPQLTRLLFGRFYERLIDGD